MNSEICKRIDYKLRMKYKILYWQPFVINILIFTLTFMITIEGLLNASEMTAAKIYAAKPTFLSLDTVRKSKNTEI